MRAPKPSRAAQDCRLAAPVSSPAWANQMFTGLGWPGYAYLAQLTQQAEYRLPAETVSTEVTRRRMTEKDTRYGLRLVNTSM